MMGEVCRAPLQFLERLKVWQQKVDSLGKRDTIAVSRSRPVQQLC
jgi:hypothetical protein